MERFRAYWPITDMIQSILKTSAAKAKGKEAQELGETTWAMPRARSERSNRKVVQNREVSQTYSMLRV